MTGKTAQDRNLQAVMTMAANGILGNWDIVRPYVCLLYTSDAADE